MRNKRRYSRAEIFSIKNKRRSQEHDQREEAKKRIQKVRNSPSAMEVNYPEYKEAYEYVDDLFPTIGVKNVTVLKVPDKVLERLGFGGVGGFCDSIWRTVVCASSKYAPRHGRYVIQAKITKDEVIVHELLHYCWFVMENTCQGRCLQEEFAYGWSLGYLRSNGHSDDDIIKYNYMPFLFGNTRNDAFKLLLSKDGITVEKYSSYTNARKDRLQKQYQFKIFKIAKEMAIKSGKEIIAIYDKKLKEGSISSNIENRKSEGFSFIDLDDD